MHAPIRFLGALRPSRLIVALAVIAAGGLAAGAARADDPATPAAAPTPDTVKADGAPPAPAQPPQAPPQAAEGKGGKPPFGAVVKDAARIPGLITLHRK
ncbi:MAG: hypothetical protein ACKO3G_17990, partial [Planctomycetaceae bacterium]